MTIDEMKTILQSRLKKNRYKHSLGVADTAVYLAKRFGENEERAYIAGLLHDCAREYKNEDLPAEADRRNIKYGTVEEKMPLLLHAYVGALRIGELYDVRDEAIAQAIWRHTVGGENMTKLDKIIYFADMIEPSRDYPEVERLRRAAQTDTLDEMTLLGLSESILFVIEKKQLIHPATIAARNELLY